MTHAITRRSALGLVPAAWLAAASTRDKPQPLPQAGEFVRFADPTTETPVVRLTTPAYNNVLPANPNPFVSLKARVLYCSSDRAGGKFTPHQIDLRTGTVRQMADTKALDPASLCLDAEGRELLLIDDRSLCSVSLALKHDLRKPQVLAEDVTAFGIGASRGELFVLRNGRLEQQRGGESILLAEDAEGPCLVRPGGQGCLFLRTAAASTAGEREFWYASATSSKASPVQLASGRIHNPSWSTDGGSLLFLRDVPKESVFLAEVREVVPEEQRERCVSRTSQFAAFAANSNDSMFVGASGSKAQPNIVLLLRSLARELTLCEHRASAASAVRLAFSPDSRRVYFQSDREGKPAIYSVNVELLVEPT